MSEIKVYHPHTKQEIGAITHNGKFQTVARLGPHMGGDGSDDDVSSHPGGPEGLQMATDHIIREHDKQEAHEAKVAKLLSAAKTKKLKEGLDEELTTEEVDAIYEEAYAELEEDVLEEGKTITYIHPKTNLKHTGTIINTLDDGKINVRRNRGKQTMKSYPDTITKADIVKEDESNSGIEVKTIAEGIEDFINASVNEDPVAAQDIFQGLLAAKISNLIDAKRQSVGASMFKEESVQEARNDYQLAKDNRGSSEKETAQNLKDNEGMSDDQAAKTAKRLHANESVLEELDDGTFYDGSDMLGEADRTSSSFQFTHKPGDAESEKKLAALKTSVKGTGKRVVLQGRLGKDNPNAHKYSKDAPQAQYKDGKRANADVSGKSGAHSHQRIQKADAAHFDVYTYSK